MDEDKEDNFDEMIEAIRAKDPRYTRDAYLFVREALDYTQRAMGKASRAEGPEGEVTHVTGQQLLGGVRDYALSQFGPMTMTVFEEWGIHQCSDFGEIVFNMVDNGLLAKTEKDSRADFAGGYEFEEAFRAPFLPPSKAVPGAPMPVAPTRN